MTRGSLSKSEPFQDTARVHSKQRSTSVHTSGSQLSKDAPQIRVAQEEEGSSCESREAIY